jgi:hypothetical protein
MKQMLAVMSLTLTACAASAQIPALNDIVKGAGNLTRPQASAASDDKTTGVRIKEALAVGTENPEQ